MVHFGLNKRATGFRIERFAHNTIARRADASAALPAARTVLAHGSPRLHSALPARALAGHLNERGLAAAPSASAGRYLCNFLYYLSLDWAGRQEAPPLASFVHIPPRSADGGPFSDADLVRGASEILRYILAFVETQQAGPSVEPIGLALASSWAMVRTKETSS
jgi:pyroglutamyl-peptidase